MNAAAMKMMRPYCCLGMSGNPSLVACHGR